MGLVLSSFPHLLPDLARDFSSGFSLFLTTLRSVSPPSLPPPSSSGSSTASHPPLSTHLSLLPLPLGVYPFRLLLRLPCRRLLVFLTLLLLLPFLSRVLPWCMGWVWVSFLLGFPLPPFTLLLYPLPLLGIPHTLMIPMRLQLLLLRLILLPMRMSDSLTTSTIRLTLPLLPYPWIRLVLNIAAWSIMFAGYFRRRRVCLLLLLLRVPCLNHSLLQRLRRPRLLIAIGLTVCGLLWRIQIVVWLRSWLLAVLSTCPCLSV